MAFRRDLVPVTLVAAIACFAARAAQAHDFWIQPSAFHVTSGQAVALRFLIGEPDAVEHWETEWRKIVSLQDVGPDALRDQLVVLRPLEGAKPTLDRVDATVTLSGEGTHIIVFTSNQLLNELPADLFTSYALHEGLTLPLSARKAQGKSMTPGRELYSRRAKALIQVGNNPSDTVSRPIGQTLEIVPDRNPYLLKAGEPLSVVVWFHGVPLAGASAVLERLGQGGTHGTPAVTNASGRVSWPLPSSGDWKINVVWSYPINDPRADYETLFCSLTFGTRPN
jgi:uncharacterized GH25 family protein